MRFDDDTFRPFFFIPESVDVKEAIIEFLYKEANRILKITKEDQKKEETRSFFRKLKEMGVVSTSIKELEQVLSLEPGDVELPFKVKILENGVYQRYNKVWKNLGIDGSKIKVIEYVSPTDTYDFRDFFPEKSYQARVEFPLNYLLCKCITYGLESNGEGLQPCAPVDTVKPRILFLDIEVDAGTQVYPRADEPKQQIVSVSLYDSYTKRYLGLIWHESYKEDQFELEDGTLVCVFNNERSMVDRLLRTIHVLDPDYLVGWNVEAFDLAYTINRCKQYLGLDPLILSSISWDPRAVTVADFDVIEQKAINRRLSIAKRKRLEFYAKFQVRIKGREIIDLLKSYKVLYQGISRDSYRLDDIASFELGEGKVPKEKSIHDMWVDEPYNLLTYNLKDVKLIVRLDEKLHIIEHFEELRKLAGIPYDDVLSKISLCKYVLLRATDKPLNSERIREEQEDWKGGRLIIPKTVSNNVINLDIRQIYPNIMIICNISPDTVLSVFTDEAQYNAEKDKWAEKKPIVVKGSSGKVYLFRSDEKGLIPREITKLIDLRKATKKEMLKYGFNDQNYEVLNIRQVSYKHTTAAFYGISSLLFEFNLGDPITGVGREVNEETEKYIRNLGYDVVYLDTDSEFYVSKESDLDKMIEEGHKIESGLNAFYPEFLKKYGPVFNPERFGIELKEIYTKIFFKGRRRYAGCLVWSEEQKVTSQLFKVGLEVKRSDTSRFARDLMEKVLHAWLIEGKDVNALVKIVREEKKKMMEGGYRLEDIGLPSGLEKLMKDYVRTNGNGEKVPLNHPRLSGRQYANDHFGTFYDRGSHCKILYVKPRNVWAVTVPEKNAFKPKYPPTKCIAFETDEEIPKDFWLTHEIDYSRMNKRNITNRLIGVFEAEGIKFAKHAGKGGTTFDEFIEGKRQRTLLESLSTT